jgi:hypothetical protein
MSDRRFDEVVINSCLITGTHKYAKSTCKTCSKTHRVEPDEFKNDNLYTIQLTDDGFKATAHIPSGAYDKDVLLFVSRMRAWNCCHEGEEPLDGFPEQDAPATIEWDQ